MRTNYDRQLKKLNDEMVEMGSMIEGVIEKAIKALVNQDVDLAQEVIRRDDQIDQQEKDIESLCFKLRFNGAAGCNRSSSGFICTQNGNGYGTYR